MLCPPLDESVPGVCQSCVFTLNTPLFYRGPFPAELGTVYSLPPTTPRLLLLINTFVYSYCSTSVTYFIHPPRPTLSSGRTVDYLQLTSWKLCPTLDWRRNLIYFE